MPRTARDPILRALNMVLFTPNGCWAWQGNVWDGYGRMRYEGKWRHVHPVLYRFFRGHPQDGTELDHLCRNRACVNPWHLEAVIHQINVIRGAGPTAINARKTACPKGHAYDYLYGNGKRACRLCINERKRGYRVAKKVATLSAAG